MATVEELKARLDKLKAQRDSGVNRVRSSGGDAVEYRDGDDIDRAISALTQEIAKAQGTTVNRRVRVFQDGKGL